MNPSSRPSLFGRAVLALLLTIGFYGLALSVAFGLLYLIYLEVAVLGRVNLRLTLIALIGAAVILWAIFPRIDRFTPPGPRLIRKKFPELFREIETMAQATGQRMPREVYLVADVNAFVAERGGFMGIGSRRVMGIGLPLFQIMTIGELNAVIAHEFGHFYGGDTSLGPWIYKTRSAIIRTVNSLGQTNELLMIPFAAYARMFLRVTNAVSRQQEFTADRLSARTVGAGAAIAGLQKVHRYALAFSAYFQQEYAPVIEAGYRPPMLGGFEIFLKAPRIQEAVNQYYEEQLTQGKTDLYDTHPSLKERIAALQSLPRGPGAPGSDRDALTLLPGSLEGLESLLLRELIVQKEKLAELKEVGWDRVVECAFLPRWERTVHTYQDILRDLTPARLFERAQNLPDFFGALARAGRILPPQVQPGQVPQEQQLQVANGVIGSALACALYRDGWTIQTRPGEDLVFVKGNRQLQPFSLFVQLASRQLSAEQWQALCEDNQIAGLALA